MTQWGLVSDSAESSTILRSFGALVVGDLVAKSLRLVATILLARALPLDEFGLLNVAIALSGIVVTTTTLGLPDVGARDAAVNPQSSAWLAGRIVTARCLATGAVVGLALAAIAIAAPSRLELAGAAACMALAMSASPDWLARGRERMRGLGLAWILGAATVAIGSVLVSRASGNVTAALWCFAGGEIVVAIGAWVTVRDALPPRLGLAGIGKLLRRSWPLALSTVVIYAYYANLDTVLLALLRSEAEAGVYSVAYRSFLVLNIAGVFAAYALLPRLSRSASRSPAGDPPRELIAALTLLLAYGALVVGFASLFGEATLELVFGERFGVTAATFILLCAAAAWYSVGYPAGYTLIALDRNREFLAGALVAGVANITLNLALIPLAGIEGAGIATLGAFVLASLVWLRARQLPRGESLRLIAGLLLITALAGVAAAFPGARVAAGAACLLMGSLVAIRSRLTKRA